MKGNINLERIGVDRSWIYTQSSPHPAMGLRRSSRKKRVSIRPVANAWP